MSDPPHDHGRFTIEPDTIPPGVRCGACHRLVLPTAVLVDDGDRPGGERDDTRRLAVRCPRCGSAGTVEPEGRHLSGSAATVVEALRRRAINAGGAGRPGIQH